jgi:hypothetical protein
LWALIYREGPCSFADLAKKHIDQAELERALERLLEAGRIERQGEDGPYRAHTLVLPLGSVVGWEAAVFDHFKALVNTVTCRLGMERNSPTLADRVGGSTYTLDVWPGHPHEQESYQILSELRSRLSELRERVERYNQDHAVPENYTQVLSYVGQCLIQQGDDETA